MRYDACREKLAIYKRILELHESKGWILGSGVWAACKDRYPQKQKQQLMIVCTSHRFSWGSEEMNFSFSLYIISLYLTSLSASLLLSHAHLFIGSFFEEKKCFNPSRNETRWTGQKEGKRKQKCDWLILCLCYLWGKLIAWHIDMHTMQEGIWREENVGWNRNGA